MWIKIQQMQQYANIYLLQCIDCENKTKEA